MRYCRSCRKSFTPRADGQIACSFHCARMLVPRGETKATRALAAAEAFAVDAPKGVQ